MLSEARAFRTYHRVARTRNGLPWVSVQRSPLRELARYVRKAQRSIDTVLVRPYHVTYSQLASGCPLTRPGTKG